MRKCLEMQFSLHLFWGLMGFSQYKFLCTQKWKKVDGTEKIMLVQQAFGNHFDQQTMRLERGLSGD